VADIHVTQELLDAVVSGKVSSQVLAQVGWQHLMSLCPFCRSEFEAWKQSRQVSGVAGVLNALPLVAERQARSLDEKRRRAEEDMRALLKLPHEERLAKVRRANSRFRGVMLVRLLLAVAESHIPAEPKAVYEIAETAQGGQTSARQVSGHLSERVRSRAHGAPASWHVSCVRPSTKCHPRDSAGFGRR
jgi:hypothetical protein